jgi:hypothetical protein
MEVGMPNDGRLDPLDGLSSPVGLGTLAVALALTRAIQRIAGKDSDVVIEELKHALTSELFNNADPQVRHNFESPIHRAIQTVTITKTSLP